MKLFARRFCSFYILLYCFPFPLGSIWGTALLEQKYRRALKLSAAWVGEHLLKLAPFYDGPTGSGDTPQNYILVSCFLILSLLAAIVWTLTEQRKRDAALYLWSSQYVRLTLAAALFCYGFAKMIPDGQYGDPTPGRLIESVGDASPMGLLWTLMDASKPYTFFAGLIEVAGGGLLLAPRWATLGGLLSIAAMMNVFMLNMCYDVPAKLYSFHLLLFSLFVAWPDMKRLKEMLVFNRPIEARVFPPFKKGFLVLQTALGISIMGTFIQLALKNGADYKSMVKNTKFFGIWRSKDTFLNKNFMSQWARIAFDSSIVCVRVVNGEWLTFRAQYNNDQNTVHLQEIDNPASSADLTLHQFSKDIVIVEGSWKGRSISMRLEKENDLSSPLLSRGFHWVTERQFNR
jgi:hypothetical protein